MTFFFLSSPAPTTNLRIFGGQSTVEKEGLIPSPFRTLDTVNYFRLTANPITQKPLTPLDTRVDLALLNIEVGILSINGMYINLVDKPYYHWRH